MIVYHLDVPQQQKDLLDQRRARVRGGVAQLLDWDCVKGTIGRPSSKSRFLRMRFVSERWLFVLRSAGDRSRRLFCGVPEGRHRRTESIGWRSSGCL